MLVRDQIELLQCHEPNAVVRFLMTIDLGLDEDEQWLADDVAATYGDAAEVTICLEGELPIGKEAQ